MAAMRVRSRFVPALLVAVVLASCWNALCSMAFTGALLSKPAAAGLRGSRTSLAAIPGAELEALMVNMPDSSTVLLAESNDAVPFVAFVVSAFMGISGYSLWSAFGPGSEDLRDPFEEHED
mmetsp:Transcript_7620/g.19457  ORF Transcript_7620/g.19457 Transcript_7620/m.19457 type:complete len:121 (+) Transcript_7620:76-438(+)|eukprot:CAMPEP_0115230152 /NCGR_PEP_ID=MMETSP0270-20121206/32570_1 /TAXON_ID=71861 /ORGANISM="Scrippsiella trochoidea, Strain CCMP3099" /LENGTH=120 /DNA_ID=CAMNT_0002644739 /DNA_START=70 /DNA_END=432 /DNA_ORIENTATION=-